MIPTGTAEKTIIDTGVTWEGVKEYKRFAVVVKTELNVSLHNVLIYLGAKALVRYTGSGAYMEFKNLGGILECVGFAGNGVTCFPTDYATDNVPSAYYHTANRGRYLFDCTQIGDADTIRLYIPSETTIERTFWIYGLTKEM